MYGAMVAVVTAPFVPAGVPAPSEELVPAGVPPPVTPDVTSDPVKAGAVFVPAGVPPLVEETRSGSKVEALSVRLALVMVAVTVVPCP